MPSKNAKRRAESYCHREVVKAIYNGVLTRPKTCEKCGKKPGLNKAGVSKIQAHHEDHSKPLVVQWLCVGCHRDVTPLAIGTRHGRTPFDEPTVLRIRERLKNGETVTAISREFKVDRRAIWQIKNRLSWRHI